MVAQQQQNNIFLTWENLAFALPLIFVCASYAFFKFVPLQYGLPILGLVAVFFQLKQTVRKQKEKKLENLDEDFIKELAGDDPDAADKSKAAQQAEKTRKAKAKLEQRLAQERKAKAKQQNGKKNGAKADDDEDDAYGTFVKGSRKKKSN